MAPRPAPSAPILLSVCRGLREHAAQSHANSGDTSTVFLGLHIEQLSMVLGKGIQGTYAEGYLAVNERMAAGEVMPLVRIQVQPETYR